MLFQVYGDASIYKFLGWILVFAGLVLANEIARRTKMGGILFFFVLPLILTVYFIAIYASAAAGATWALENDTYVHMTSWFHYAKLYAATAGCIGFHGTCGNRFQMVVIFRGRMALRRMVEHLKRYRRTDQHLLYDRMVGHLFF